MITFIKYLIIVFGIIAFIGAGLILAFDGDIEKLKAKFGKGKQKVSDSKNPNKKSEKKSDKKSESKNKIKFKYTQDLVDKGFDDIIELNSNDPVGLVVRNDKKEYIGIIQVFGLNYNLLSIEEREQLEDSFGKLLNGIDYPIEITIQSSRIEMEKYYRKFNNRLEEMKKNIEKINQKIKFLENKEMYEEAEILKLVDKKTRLERQYNNYGIYLYKWIFEVCGDQSMIDRKYYISVTHNHDKGKFKEELTYEEISANAYFDISNKCNSIISALKRAKLNGKLLDGIGVAEVIYKSYNKADSKNLKIRNAIKNKFSHIYITSNPVELKVIKRRIEELKVVEENLGKSIQELENEMAKENTESEKVGA